VIRLQLDRDIGKVRDGEPIYFNHGDATHPLLTSRVKSDSRIPHGYIRCYQALHIENYFTKKAIEKLP